MTVFKIKNSDMNLRFEDFFQENRFKKIEETFSNYVYLKPILKCIKISSRALSSNIGISLSHRKFKFILQTVLKLVSITTLSEQRYGR